MPVDVENVKTSKGNYDSSSRNTGQWSSVKVAALSTEAMQQAAAVLHRLNDDVQDAILLLHLTLYSQ